MIHKLTTSFAAIVLMAAGATAHADITKISLPDGFTHDGKTVHNNNGSNTHFDTITGPNQYIRRAHTTVTPSTSGGNPAIDHTSNYQSQADGIFFHNGYVVTDGEGSMGHQGATTTSKGTHVGDLEITANPAGGKPSFDHKGSFTSADGSISHEGELKTNVDSNAATYITYSGKTTTPKGTHTGSVVVNPNTGSDRLSINRMYSYTSADGATSHYGTMSRDGNGSIYRSETTTTAKGTHNGLLNVMPGYIDHEGSFASADASISHDGRSLKSNMGYIIHEGTTTTAKGTHTGSLQITESTAYDTSGKSAVDHEGSFGSRDGSVYHNGYAVTDGHGSLSHKGTTSDLNGTHNGSLDIITASTTGGKSAVSHQGDFGSRDGSVYHGGYAVTDGHGSLSHKGTTSDLNGTHNGSLDITASTTGGNAAINHEGSFALNKDHVFESLTHQGYTITDGNGTMSHWGLISGDKGTHNGTTEINKTTSNIDHEGAFTTSKGLIHNGETFVNKDTGAVTHSASNTTAGGATHEGSITIVPSTTGGKPTINHTGSFTPPFAIR